MKHIEGTMSVPELALDAVVQGNSSRYMQTMKNRIIQFSARHREDFSHVL